MPSRFLAVVLLLVAVGASGASVSRTPLRDLVRQSSSPQITDRDKRRKDYPVPKGANCGLVGFGQG